jgi:hypothetical protein
MAGIVFPEINQYIDGLANLGTEAQQRIEREGEGWPMLFSDTEGTRLEMTFDVRLTGRYRLLAPFARGFIARKTSREWDDYVRAMQAGR